MTELEALLRAVCAAPDDDLPRLVFADWLQENGEPERAEFIRVQCRHARLDPECDEAERLYERADELLTEWYPVWKAELPDHPAYQWWFFHRGFIPRLHVDDFTVSFAADLDVMFARTPLVHLSFGEPFAAATFVRSPHFARIQLVYVNCDLTRDLIAALTTAARPPGLWGITLLRKQTLTPADVEALRARYGERVRV